MNGLSVMYDDFAERQKITYVVVEKNVGRHQFHKYYML